MEGTGSAEFIPLVFSSLAPNHWHLATQRLTGQATPNAPVQLPLFAFPPSPASCFCHIGEAGTSNSLRTRSPSTA